MSDDRKQGNFLKSLSDRQKQVAGIRDKKVADLVNRVHLDPKFCAKTVITGSQIFVISVVIITTLTGLTIIPQITIAAYAIIFSLFYLLLVFFRAAVLKDLEAYVLIPDCPVIHRDHNDKHYSILVALYKEAGQVADLVEALSALEWPKNQRQIFLICEADDNATIAAIQELAMPDDIKLIICPPGAPRTKPRALTYALRYCRGDYLVLYDAEDRPHPLQLLEAHQKFIMSDENLVCLQAPLVIDNGTQSWLTRMFTIEYITLFYGIIPCLAFWRAPMPLGGTSNHFKLAKLVAAGGWNAFNVTEDADLGIRLSRFGYHCGAISLPTWEEAPARFKSWLPQRSRWIKGWIVTFLVHMRNPRSTRRDLGWRITSSSTWCLRAS